MQKYDWILERVAEVESALREKVEGLALEEDARDLVEELLAHAGQNYNFPLLSQRMLSRHALDLDTLRQGIAFLSSHPWPDAIQITPNLTIQPTEELTDLEQGFARMQSQLVADPAANVGVSLDFLIGGSLLRLVMGAIKQGYSLDSLTALVRQKVSLLAEQQLVQLWSYVQQEFDPDRNTHMEMVQDIVPADFLTFGSNSQAREKLARYVVEWKPRLLLAAYDRRGSGYPLEVPTLPNILTWRADTEVEPPSLQETTLAKSIARILEMASQLFHISIGELAAVLRITPNSPVVRARNPIPSTARHPPITALCYEVRKAARLLSQLALVEADFPRCIRRYKLGHEVMAPHLNQDIETKGEILL